MEQLQPQVQIDETLRVDDGQIETVRQTCRDPEVQRVCAKCTRQI